MGVTKNKQDLLTLLKQYARVHKKDNKSWIVITIGNDKKDYKKVKDWLDSSL